MYVIEKNKCWGDRKNFWEVWKIKRKKGWEYRGKGGEKSEEKEKEKKKFVDERKKCIWIKGKEWNKKKI